MKRIALCGSILLLCAAQAQLNISNPFFVAGVLTPASGAPPATTRQFATEDGYMYVTQGARQEQIGKTYLSE